MSDLPRRVLRLAQWSQRHAPALAALAAIGLAAVVTTWSGAAIPDPGWNVTPASAMTNLVDGQRVSVNVKANSDVVISNIQIQECRLGATYVTQADMFAAAGNCPPTAVSSSSSGIVVRSSANGIIQLVQTPDGATITYRVGTGVVQWQAGSGATSLACDETHPSRAGRAATRERELRVLDPPVVVRVRRSDRGLRRGSVGNSHQRGEWTPLRRVAAVDQAVLRGGEVGRTQRHLIHRRRRRCLRLRQR